MPGSDRAKPGWERRLKKLDEIPERCLSNLGDASTSSGKTSIELPLRSEKDRPIRSTGLVSFLRPIRMRDCDITSTSSGNISMELALSIESDRLRRNIGFVSSLLDRKVVDRVIWHSESADGIVFFLFFFFLFCLLTTFAMWQTSAWGSIGRLLAGIAKNRCRCTGSVSKHKISLKYLNAQYWYWAAVRIPLHVYPVQYWSIRIHTREPLGYANAPCHAIIFPTVRKMQINGSSFALTYSAQHALQGAKFPFSYGPCEVWWGMSDIISKSTVILLAL